MRKIALLTLTLILSLCLFGCMAYHESNLKVNDSNRYQIKEVKEIPQLQYYYTENNSKVGIFYLGRVANVPLSCMDGIEHKTGSFKSTKYTDKDITEESFNFAKATAISEVISSSVAPTLSYTTENGGTATVTVSSNATINPKYNIVEVLKNNQHLGGSYSFVDTFACIQEFVNSKKCDFNFKLGIIAETATYRMGLFGSCDFYAFVVYDEQSNAVLISYDLSVVKSSLEFAIDSTTAKSFGANNEYKGGLTFDTSVISNGELFDKQSRFLINYVLNDGKFNEQPKEFYTLTNVELSTPSLEYFEFGGWYLDEGFTLPATAEALRQKACDLTLYAKWNTVVDIVNWAGFTGLTSNIKGQETGKINTVDVSDAQLQTYIYKGYRARITFYYTASVPLEYEGTKDSSDMKVQLGFSNDTSGSVFLSQTEHYHAEIAPGASVSDVLTFECALSYLQNYKVAVKLIILSNDTDVLGICGKDAGTYSNLKMVIEYIK